MKAQAISASAGFSLAEMLVALAIVAGLVLGIGALVGAVTDLTARTTDADAILNALIDVEGAALALGRATNVDRPLVALPDRFELSAEARGELTRTAVTVLFEIHQPSASSRLDLSAFDAVSLEYLSPSETRPWSAAPSDLAGIDGIRFVLRHGPRTWRPLLWLRGRYTP